MPRPHSIHYLRPDGERVMEIVPSDKVFVRQHFVQFLDEERGVVTKVPYWRILLMEEIALGAGEEADEGIFKMESPVAA